jgi:hypothetical protein
MFVRCDGKKILGSIRANEFLDHLSVIKFSRKPQCDRASKPQPSELIFQRSDLLLVPLLLTVNYNITVELMATQILKCRCRCGSCNWNIRQINQMHNPF